MGRDHPGQGAAELALVLARLLPTRGRNGGACGETEDEPIEGGPKWQIEDE